MQNCSIIDREISVFSFDYVVTGGTLHDYIDAKKRVHKTVSEDQARFFFVQILSAVEHIVSTPRNVFL